MKFSEKIMGMDAAFELLDNVHAEEIDEVLNYFYSIDRLFSPYRKDSEISKINRGAISVGEATHEVRMLLKLCEEIKLQTKGYFDVYIEKHYNLNGVVKGYAISKVCQLLLKKGYSNFYIEIGGDLQINGTKNGNKFRVGIENPIKKTVHVVRVSNRGLATTGLSTHGLPIYNPLKKKISAPFKSITVIAQDALNADWLSTSLMAMGEKGLEFLDQKDAEALFVRHDGSEIMTSGFRNYM